MDPRLQNLLTNSASITKIVPDQQLLMQLWVDALFYGLPTDWGTLSSYPSGLEFISPQQSLAIEIYALANKLGLPTDGQQLYNRLIALTGSQTAPGARLPVLIENAWFRNIGAY